MEISSIYHVMLVFGSAIKRLFPNSRFKEATNARI
jgi:hypothetical protein